MFKSNKKEEKKKVDGHVDDDKTEVDYDVGATQLYKFIESKQWDKAIARIDSHPHEARTWIFRRSSSDPKQIKWRLLPLHATCVFRSPLAVIEALISAYPDGAQMKDDQNMLPIHLACRNGASKGVVLTLLYTFPESVSSKDRKGRTPMNLVESSESQNRDVVVKALRNFSEQTHAGGALSTLDLKEPTKENEVDFENRTVLFRHILKNDWNAACSRCQSHPEEAATWIVTKGFQGSLRFLPLHKACVLQPKTNIIDSLISAYPDGAKSKDQDGWLPLHCACFYGTSQTIINALLEAYPNGAYTKDDEGRMPLHYAAIKGAGESVVSALLKANPKAAVCKDDDGRLPIHHACAKNAPAGSIKALLKVSAKGSQSKDDQGRLPLHHLCRKNGSKQATETLLKINPRGAQVKDDSEKLPIHYACQAGSDENIVKMLLTIYPECVIVKNS
jgi:ankyrin repeat protein